MPSDYVRTGQKAKDEKAAKDASKRAGAAEDTEIVRPGEGLGLAARIAAMKAKKKATPTPAPKKESQLSALLSGRRA